MRKLTLIGIAALAAAVLALVPTALAAGGKDGKGMVKRGSCSAGSSWKLKAKLDNGRIEAEFEVDQNRVGRRWRVKLAKGNATVFNGIRTTVAPSGSLTVRRLLAGSPGSARIVASARALQGGESCRGIVTL
jgi:hypothetical protein